MSITPDHPTTSQPVSSNTTTTIAIDHQHQHHRHRHSGPQCMPYALITTDRLAEQQNGQNKPPPPPKQITINGRTTILTRWKQKLNKKKTATYSKLTNTTSLLRLCLQPLTEQSGKRIDRPKLLSTLPTSQLRKSSTFGDKKICKNCLSKIFSQVG